MGFFNRWFGKKEIPEDEKFEENQENINQEDIKEDINLEKKQENEDDHIEKGGILQPEENRESFHRVDEEKIYIGNPTNKIEIATDTQDDLDTKLKEKVEEELETSEVKSIEQIIEQNLDQNLEDVLGEEIQKPEDEKLEENKSPEEETKEEETKEEVVKEKKGFFASLKERLFKSREGLFGGLKALILGRSVIDEQMYEELEDMLIQSDIGMDMTVKITERLEKEVKKRGIKNPRDVYPVLKEVMEEFLIKEDNQIKIEDGKLNVILVVGVNGVGKTTTIGKLASKYIKEGKKVVLGAGDTFRAAAIEQLEEWAKRSGAEIVKSTQGSDPGAVVFDTIASAQAKNADIAIIDTAGRLHNKNNLMKELEKIHNIIKKKIGDSYYESILVIDGTTGQNALNQARVFNEVTKLTGLIITKLDGTAKGGIVFAISEELKKPIKYIGVGEKIEDLRVFDAKEYIDAIFD